MNADYGKYNCITYKGDLECGYGERLSSYGGEPIHNKRYKKVRRHRSQSKR